MSATTTPRPTASPAPTTSRWAIAAVVAALVTLVVALVLGGGGSAAQVPGLPDPGATTRWGLPLAKLVLDAAATVSVGFLLLAVLLPAPDRTLTGESLRALRIASGAALVWAAATVVVHLLTLSDLIGLPLSDALAGSGLASFTLSMEQGQAYATVLLLTLVLAPAARLTLGKGGAIGLLVLGLAALVPPALTGHASSSDYHHSAATSLIVHVLAVAVWVGGLVALSWYGARRGQHLARAAATYSVIAIGAFVGVAASGLFNVLVRMSTAAELVTTSYGLLVLAKVTALVALGVLGAAHRRRTLPGLQAGRPGSFRRLAAGEIVIMAATIGLAVALSRTAPPAAETVPNISHARELLGYPIPPEFTLTRLLTEPYPDAFFGLGTLAAALLYLAGVRRLRARGDRWPVGRTISWLLGLGTLAFLSLSGFTTYGMIMLSVHMTSHMIVAMLVPVLLVLGAPISLSLRAIRPARRGELGPREMITAVIQSRFVRVLTHPIVVFVIFVSATYMVYFTGLFEVAMRSHTGHILMVLHFLLGGYLFYEVLIGVDPLPKRPPHVVRIVMQFGAMGFHAFFGVAMMESARLIAGDFYAEIRPDIAWLPDTLADQQLAGSITWGFTELPALVVLIALFVQWARSEERAAKRYDRKAGQADAELAAYNEYLASLDRRRD